MSRAPMPPSLGADNFSCPHCGALAHQYWNKVIIENFKDKTKPTVITEQMVGKMKSVTDDDGENKRRAAFQERFLKNDVTYLINRYSSDSHSEMVNTCISQCHSCRAFAFWVRDRLVYPARDIAILPHDDMPADVKVDFVEASEIVDKSPRGAAALLRLALQKMMPHLEEDGKNLNDSIASLVKKGLDKKVQQALDVVRVTGNNAVHPGELDLKDDRATATQLFALLNIIVQSTISAKAQIEAMYASLPQSALKSIEKRDS